MSLGFANYITFSLSLGFFSIDRRGRLIPAFGMLFFDFFELKKCLEGLEGGLGFRGDVFIV